jgi:2-keto-4-pentenoate hydratase/2-oxohepta-3-ene-1,7-dioic acid hydratase in catechol pathway
VESEHIVDVGAVLRDKIPDLRSAIASAILPDLGAAARGAKRYPLADIQWLPVIPNPDKILCVGLNYEMHRQETGRAVVENPTIFTRFANSQTGHLTDLRLPRVSSDLDYEAELAVIIGRRGRYISRANAAAHIAGYSCYNDGSVRDWQRHTSQYTPGKNFPATGGFGPWMVTPDEVGVLAPLRIQMRVSGDLLQDAKLGDMIFDVPRLLEYCSSFTTLEPGDVIATGTPGGVGAKREPPRWLKKGDKVEVTIDRIGTLRNGVADELIDPA